MKLQDICSLIVRILRAVFVITLVGDYMSYNSYVNSAPFYVFVLGNAVTTLLPAAVVFFIGRKLKKRDSSSELYSGEEIIK